MPQRYLLIISNPNQAAFRLRWSVLMPQLEQRGIGFDVAVRPKSAIARYRLARRAREYPGAIIQRKLLEPWEARVLRKSAKRIFFDVDDAVMFQAHKHSAFSPWRQKRRLVATAQALDLAVVGNEYLREQFLTAGCRECRVLPTMLDVGRYSLKRHEAGTPLRLVWIGSKSTLPYLAEIVPMLESLHAKPHNLELITIADATAESKTLPIRHIAWSEAGEAAALVQGDIGIAPTPNTPWAMGKCGFKILQYMASALPVIASPVGANATIVNNGVSGFLADAPDQWAAAISALSDPAARQRMGDAAREVVCRDYPLSRAVDFWAQQLTPVAHATV